MFVHTLPKSGINARGLVSRAIHGLVPMRPTPDTTEFTRNCVLAYPFGLFSRAPMEWLGTGQYKGTRNHVLWRGRNPFPGGADRLLVDLPAPWAAPLPWIPMNACDATVVIETWKDVGSSWAGDSIGTSFGPRAASARLSAHITEQTTVVFDNPSELSADRLSWDWFSNVDKFPEGRVHTMVFLARAGVRELWVGGVKVASKTGANDFYWNEGSASGWYWYGSAFPGTYGSSNVHVGHGACGYWNYALTERECRVLSMGFGPLLEGMPRQVMLGSGYYDLAQLIVRARRLG